MPKSKKLKIAVTGGIGSGKTTFCNILKEKHYPVISADEVSKNILANDPKVKEQIIKIFGKNSFLNGQINKTFLAEKIFSDAENVLKVNSILHPVVIEKTAALLEENLKKNDIAFVEAALIYEADMEFLFDYVVLITADEKNRMQRKINFDNFTEQDFIKRNENQIPDEEKKKRADFIFMNDGTKEDLKKKADLLILTLKGLLTVND